MALSKGINSYVTLAEASSYFADRLDVSAWTDASDSMKSQALVTASLTLNDQNWTGIAVSESQPLAFPRSGSYFDPRLGIEVSLTDEVPTRIINATYELAYHLLNNDGVLDDTGSLSNLQVSSISLTFQTAPNTIPPTVKRLIKPLLINSGTNLWWRAN